MVLNKSVGRRQPDGAPLAASLIANWRRRKYNDHRVRYPFLPRS